MLFAAEPRPVILISVDTLRADHLSCYGYKRVLTPSIDSLARGGTVFGEASAQVPLTLPSHVSLLTSSLPFTNGVRDNGQQVVSRLPNLAEVLKSHGYATGAFVGGFVLDRRFGMNRGFDTYDSPFDAGPDASSESPNLKRPADQVADAAWRWMSSRKDQPFFAFLHFYDLHTPYKLPPAYRTRFAGSEYDGALSFVDSQLGLLFQKLQAAGILQKALIVFLADHGESLGQHREKTHGYFIYQSTLRVPLIMRAPAGSLGLPDKVEEPVGLIDVAPAVLAHLGFSAPAEFQGRSFLSNKGASALREIYSESLYASYHFGCAPLLSLRRGRYKYVEAPKPEFYDLKADPGELKNLITAQNDLADPFRSRLSAIRKLSDAAATTKPADADVVRRLTSLGYLANSSAAGSASRDPKDAIDDYESSRRGVTLMLAGRTSEAATVFQSVLARSPDFLETRGLLGTTLQKLGRNEEAVQEFRRYLQRDPLNIAAHYNLAVSYSETRRLEDAVKELEAVLALCARNAGSETAFAISSRELLGRIHLEQKNYGQAKADFAELLKLDSRNFVAHYNLGWQATLDQQWDEAARHLQSAAEISPGSAAARNALGNVYLRKGDILTARSAFQDAVRVDPKDAWGHYNLGLTWIRQGDATRAAVEFREALSRNPQMHEAQRALARLGDRAN